MDDLGVASDCEKIANLIGIGSVLQAEMIAVRRLESSPTCGLSKLYIGLLAMRRGDEVRLTRFWSAIDNLSVADGLTVYRSAHEAMKFGYTEAARQLLLEYVKGAGNAVAPIWLLLGQVFDRNGESQFALKAWFQALKLAQGIGEWRDDASTPAEILPMVRHAMRAVNVGRQTLLKQVLELLMEQMGSRALLRVERAIECYLGIDPVGPDDRRQAPKFFYFPGLTDQPYHNPRTQPWAKELEATFPAIRQEALELLNDPSQFTSFLTFRPQENIRNYVAGDGVAPAWDAYFFYRHGQRIDAHHARCPQTSALLDRIERCEIAGQAPEICFSLLAPGSHIMPHYGVTNTRLVMHLPLFVPPGCALNIIGAGEHHWREGELMMFDDTFLHEAWNRSESPRVILLMDCWNPELTPEERLAVKKLVETISDFENNF